VFGAQWLPRVGVMAQVVVSTTNNSTTTMLGTNAVDLPRIGATTVSSTVDWLPAPSTTAAIGVRQQLFDFGRTGTEVDAARARTAVERARLSLSGLELRIAVIQAWHAVKASHAVLRASAEALGRARTLREQVQASVNAKLRAPVEAARAEVEVQRAEVVRLRSEAQLAMAQLQLGALVGSQTALDAAGESALTPPPPSLETFLSGAGADARLHEAEARAHAQETQALAAAAQWRPSLSATAALSGRAGGASPNQGPVPFGAGWLPVVPNWDVGVVLTWQVLDPVTSARAEAAHANARAAMADVEVTRQGEATSAALGWLEADASVRALPALKLALDSAVASQQQADARFRLGLISLLELADAERLRTEAEMQLALGELAVARATSNLERFQPSRGTP
jgi:outer membrane protein